jgi:hypothetical protein
VPAATGIAATDTANIQNTINLAQSGDTVAFQSGGQYVVNTTIYLAYHSGSTTTVYNNVVFNGNGCTIADGGISWFIMDIPWGSTNITFNQFTLKGQFPNTSTNTVANTAYDGGLMIEGGSNITVENSLFEDFGSSNGLVGGENVGTGISVGSTLTNAVITGNTFTEVAEYGIFFGAGGGVSGPLTVSYNTFSIGDCVQGADYGNCTFQSLNGIGTSNAAVLYQYNTGSCVRNGIEICPGGDNTGPKLTNLQVTGNTMSYTNTQNDGNGLIYSFAFGGTGTITNNVAIGQSGAGVGYENQLCNSTYTNNTVENAGLGFASAGTANDVFTYNLVANTNNFYDDPWGFGKQGLAANNLYNNWFYASNTNAAGNFCDSTYYNSGNDAYFGNTSTAPGENTCISSPAVCPTLSIAETSNATVGGANGVFTITSSVAPPSGYPLSVYYTLSGTGVNGTDYTITPASPATIAAGTTSTTLSVTGINSGKTVIATLAFGGYYINSASKSATMNINAGGSLPTVTVAASPTSVNEASGTSTYTVTRTGATTSALTVYYAMSGTASNGTDYTTLSGSMTIASGSATGTVTLTATDRQIVTGSKTAILTISTNANYTVGSPSSTTVTINDNDTSAIPTANLQLWLKADAGVTGSNVSNWADLSGNNMNAAQGTSTYQPLYVSNDVNGKPGLRFNGTNQYLSMPAGFSGLNNGDTIFVVTNPTGVTSYGEPLRIAVNGSNGIGFMRSGTTQAWDYWVDNGSWSQLASSGSTNLTQSTWQLLEAVQSGTSATMYVNGANAITGTVDAVNSQSYPTNTIGADAYDGQYWQGDITEVIIYNSALSTTNRQTVESYLTSKYGIGGLPTVTVAATPTSINEAGGTSTYTFTRTGSTTSSLTVNYAMSGTATNGTDYNTLSGSLTIASGSATGTAVLTTIDRGLTSGSKTAILTISTNANYTVGSPSSATVTINDNDALPTVTVTASPTSINEYGGTSTYTVTRTGATTAALTVNYAMSGTATNGTDYTTLAGSLTIAIGSSTGTVTLTTIDRHLTTGSLTAILTISINANYTVGSPSNATVTISDNDGSVSGSTATASTSTYALTTLGTTDWSHWNACATNGVPGSGWIHKSSGGSQISTLTPVGSCSNYGNWYTTNRNVSWTDGTPTTSNADDQYYIWCNGTTGQGWSFTVPADTTTRTLNILWGGANSAAVKLVAHLSDGTATDYTDALTLPASGNPTQLETITYHAAPGTGKTLTITLTKNDSNSGTSVDVDAAYLH